MVYIAFRRGNWLHSFLHGVCLGRLARTSLVYRLVRLCCVRDSWMACALVFPMSCTGAGCRTCARCGNTSRVDYHTCTIGPDAEDNIMRATADGLLDKPDAWVFLRLPRVSADRASALFSVTMAQRMGWNHGGRLLNFMPRWLSCWRGPVGLFRGEPIDEDTGSVFCSEMLTAFVQANGYPLDLDPCTTTPQALHTALLDRYPDLLQQVIHPDREQSRTSLASRLRTLPVVM